MGEELHKYIIYHCVVGSRAYGLDHEASDTDRRGIYLPYPLLFATISGAHFYGFASGDSDYDPRGVHVSPAREVLSLQDLRETIESEVIVRGVEIDLVTHDAAKLFKLMLNRNGYVLEQLLSPLVVLTSPEHEELKSLATGYITRHHAHHHLGFGDTQWNLFAKESPRRVKPLLYVYRVLLTGIHLMRTGELDANLPRLNEVYCLPRCRNSSRSRRAETSKASCATRTSRTTKPSTGHCARDWSRSENARACRTSPPRCPH